jgi:methyltransferase-like protein 6
VGDHAQMRFSEEKRLEENLYVRQDGTLSFFATPGKYEHTRYFGFSNFCFLDHIESLFLAHGGFEKLENGIIDRKLTNMKEDMEMDRKFIQSRWKYKGE